MSTQSSGEYPCLFDRWNPCANIKEYRKLCKRMPPICDHIRQAVLKPGDVEFYALMDSNCHRDNSTCPKPEASQIRIIARWEGQVNRSNTKFKKLGYRLKSFEGEAVHFRADNGQGASSSEQKGELYVFPAYSKVDQSRCKVKSIDVVKNSTTALQRIGVQIKAWSWKDEETRGKQQELVLEVAVPPEAPTPDSENRQPEPESQRPTAVAPEPLMAFISYAHEDEEIKKKLVKYLRSLKDAGLVSVWHDRETTAGREWHEEIKKYLNRAQIILLLISNDFLGSSFIETVELKRALERHEAGDARVIPVTVRESDWLDYPALAKLQAAPPSGKAITEYPSEDKWFTEVKIELRRVIRELMGQRQHK